VKGSGLADEDARGLAEVVEAFAAANSRDASPLERQLLAGLAEEYDRPARVAGETGARWVAAAIVEAVEAGSRYVAPRRIRQILQRWAEQGAAGMEGSERETSARDDRPGDPVVAPRVSRRASARGPLGYPRHAQARGGAVSSPSTEGSAPRTGNPTGDPIADGAGGRDARLQGAETAPLPGDGVDVPADRSADASGPDGSAVSPTIPTFLVDPTLGLTNRQLWAAVLDELRRTVSPGSFATWLKPTRLIGLEGTELVVGVPNSYAREWLGERFASQVESAVEVVLGSSRRVRFAVEREWLASANGGTSDRS
jgi:hypothetical protein